MYQRNFVFQAWVIETWIKIHLDNFNSNTGVENRLYLSVQANFIKMYRELHWLTYDEAKFTMHCSAWAASIPVNLENAVALIVETQILNIGKEEAENI